MVQKIKLSENSWFDAVQRVAIPVCMEQPSNVLRTIPRPRPKAKMGLATARGAVEIGMFGNAGDWRQSSLKVEQLEANRSTQQDEEGIRPRNAIVKTCAFRQYLNAETCEADQ
jgi:hypothetical protein